MADDKKTKRLLNEKSYRRMQVFAGLITEAQAEQMDEADSVGSDDINQDTVVKESEELDPLKPKDNPLYKDAKGTDKVGKNVKGGPSADLEKVAKPTFNLKEGEMPPLPSGPEEQTDPNPDVGGEKLTVDADEFSNDLALSLSRALQKHFGSQISVTTNGAAPATDSGLDTGAGLEAGFEDVPLEDEGMGVPPETQPAPQTPDSSPVPPQPNPEEERKQFESKKNKLMESMVSKIMNQIVNDGK